MNPMFRSLPIVLLFAAPAPALATEFTVDVGLDGDVDLDPIETPELPQLPDFSWAFTKAGQFGDGNYAAGYSLRGALDYWSEGAAGPDGDELEATGKLEAWARLNGTTRSLMLVTGRAFGRRGDDAASIYEASGYIGGYQIFHEEWDGTFDDTRTWDATFFTVTGNFTVGGVPVTANLTARGSLGYDLYGVVNPTGQIDVHFEPRGEAHVTGSAGVGIGGLSAGVYTSLTLLEAHVPVDATASLTVSRLGPRLTYGLDADLELQSLDGELGLYAGPYELPLFAWVGLQTTIGLIDVSGVVQL